MIVYVISSPHLSELLLTANPILAGLAEDEHESVEIATWDTEKTPLCSINLKFQEE